MVSSGRYYFSDVESEVLLLVEGTDEVRFFYALLKSLDRGHIQIASVDGKDNFAPVLKNVLMTFRNYQRLRRLVLVRDADDNAQAAFQSLRSALTELEPVYLSHRKPFWDGQWAIRPFP